MSTNETYIAPRNEMEQTIAAVWRNFLRIDRMSIHDNFFDVGGHSLVLLQVRSKLCEVLEREISIATMFEYPTINSLAEHLTVRAPEAPTFLKLRGDAAARKASLARRSRVSAHSLN